MNRRSANQAFLLFASGSLCFTSACGLFSSSEAPSAPEHGAAASSLPDAIPTDDLKNADQAEASLVPSPRELVGALSAAGIDAKLADLVTAHTWHTDNEESDRVAVRAGVIVADILLTLKSAPDAELIDRLARLQESMRTLGGGDDIDRTLADIQERIKAGAVDRDSLLNEIDELSQAVIPELKFNGVARIVPLIQAGSWLEGSSLVAKAAKARNAAAAAGRILKQPDVVAYFKKYTSDTEDSKVSSDVAKTLDATLDELQQVATKTSDLETADVETVIRATDAVMALL